MLKTVQYTLLFLLTLATGASVQQVLTLPEAIEMARLQSVDAAVALNELKTSYWEYRTYRADLLPEVNFSASLPDYRRSYNLYQSDDGTYKFVRTNSLGVTGDISIDPVIPEMERYPEITYPDVLEKAQKNNPLVQNIRRRQLEADYEVAQAKGAQRQIDLFASVGYTGQDQAFRSAYQNLMDYQVVQVGVKIPILDWGKRKGRVKVAESNREVVASRLKQKQMNFNQDIFLLVEQYKNQAEQLRIAREANEIAQRRYNTSVESFMIGKINTLDLNDAQLSKDNARASYVSEMHLYWYYLYQLRSLTLHDFVRDTSLDAEFEQLIN